MWSNTHTNTGRTYVCALVLTLTKRNTYPICGLIHTQTQGVHTYALSSSPSLDETRLSQLNSAYSQPAFVLACARLLSLTYSLAHSQTHTLSRTRALKTTWKHPETGGHWNFLWHDSQGRRFHHWCSLSHDTLETHIRNHIRNTLETPGFSTRMCSQHVAS